MGHLGMALRVNLRKDRVILFLEGVTGRLAALWYWVI